MQLHDVRPGVPFDPRFLARVTPGTLPPPAQIVSPAVVVEGVAFVPVPGARGLDGVDGAAVITRTAPRPLGGHRVIVQTPAGLDYGDCRTPLHADGVFGLSTGSATTGAPITLQRGGEIEEPSWAWAPGPVLLGYNGLLTQTLPADAAFQMVIGFSIDPHTLYVAPREPIALRE